jgi:hypothetical protein
VTATIESLPSPASLSGEVIRPGDPDDDQARRVHTRMIDKRLALIALAAGRLTSSGR